MKLSGGQQIQLSSLLRAGGVVMGSEWLSAEDFTEVDHPQMEWAARGGDLDMDIYKILDAALRVLDKGLTWRIGSPT